MKINYKDKKILLSIILIVVGLLFIIISSFILLNKSEKNDDNAGNTEDNPVIVDRYNGIYINDDSNIKLFSFGNKLKILIDTPEFSMEGTMEEKDSIYKLLKEDKEYTIKLVTDGIEFDTTDKLLKSGFYKKSDDYSKEDYYLSTFGDSKFIDSKYNCQFMKDDIEINLLQINDTKLMISLKSSKTELYAYAIKENNTDVFNTEQLFFDMKINYLENDQLDVKIDLASVPETELLYYEDINGTYELKNKYNDIDKIIDVFSLDY